MPRYPRRGVVIHIPGNVASLDALLWCRLVSQTPTYDQLHDERIKATRTADSLQVDHFGKHCLHDDTIPVVAVRDQSPEPETGLAGTCSGVRTGRGVRRSKQRTPADGSGAPAAGGRPARRAVDRAEDWSWFGSDQSNYVAARNVVAIMSAPMLLERTRALLTVLTELNVRSQDRVLIMFPQGPGFTESFAAAFYRDAVPLPVNPLLSAPDLAAAVTQTHARLVLASPEQLPTLTELNTQPPMVIDGPQGPWAAALRLR